MTLTHLLWESPAAGTRNDCLGDEDRILSYAEVEDLALAFAEQLAELGVAEGEVLGIMLENSIELVIGMLGAWIAGVTATPINPTFTERELSYQLEDSAAKLLLTERSILDRLPGLTAPGSAVPVLDVAAMRTERSGDAGTIEIDPESIALLIYTSGSTGQPKGVMLDHANLDAMARGMAAHAEMTAEERALVVLPFFHVNAICVSWLAPMSVGGSTIILRRFAPVAFLEAIEKHRPTYFSVVPAILARLVQLPSDVSTDFSSIRFVICGAAPVSRELLQLCAERFGLLIIEGYGLTEATCVSAGNPLRGPQKLGTVGPVVVGQELKLTDEHGAEVAVGERGEVRIKGATVMRGYLGRPEATAETVVDGWLRTGDVGVLDEDGYLSIVDRIKDMIIRGGENIYPKEIEAHLATHQAVLESAVVGAPHPTLGEVPVAYVVTQSGSEATAAELLAHCSAGLMKIKVPARLEVVSDLPRNPVGKVDKPELRRQTVPIGSANDVGAPHNAAAVSESAAATAGVGV
ncbi:class I adenylate-forming enzyme family protein [Leucobacter chinensis]|uniref:class I adenylate-forming enzyme family protein n=1 Tax=Leucobacter chinensis TaxID=2851010 RepID=UPI001C21DCC9|nr:AMP-binding protein [Leucobacter chinensis]